MPHTPNKSNMVWKNQNDSEEHGDILDTLDAYFADRFVAQRIDGVLDRPTEAVCKGFVWNMLLVHMLKTCFATQVKSTWEYFM